jgi:putative two-component system response regulator
MALPPESDLESAPEAQAMVVRTMFGGPRVCVAPPRVDSPDEIISNPRVAIIDDQPLNIRVVQKHLAMIGYQQFFTTTDATQALTLIRQEHPDVVLLDIMMPEISGLEILQQLRKEQEFEDLPVIILTAASDSETKLTALDLGATDFLGKPVDQAELQTRLRNVLTIKANQDRLKNYAWELELEVAVRTTELADAYRDVVYRLAKVGEYRDSDTGYHVARVSRCAEIVAARLGLDQELVRRIGQAASLHDIGKVGIRDAILLKPGRLTDEEFEEMKRHCDLGYAICSNGVSDCDSSFPTQEAAGGLTPGVATSPVLQTAAIIAKSHHEKWDGTGYPSGLAGAAIPLEARIVAIVDVFDALTSRRPYKPPYSLQGSLAIIEQQRGKHFDPQVVDAFQAEIEAIGQVYQDLSDVRPAFAASDNRAALGDE